MLSSAHNGKFNLRIFRKPAQHFSRATAAVTSAAQPLQLRTANNHFLFEPQPVSQRFITCIYS
jgi:hypothetical protein